MAEPTPATCNTEGCNRSLPPIGDWVKCCITCGIESFPDVHLAYCEVRNGTHHSQQSGSRVT